MRYTLILLVFLSACVLGPAEPEGTSEFASSRWCDVYCETVGDICEWSRERINDCGRFFDGQDGPTCQDRLYFLIDEGYAPCDWRPSVE